MQIKKFYNKDSYGNSYIVIDNNKFIMIDCSQSMDNIAKILGAIKIKDTTFGSGDIVYECSGIFITHSHYDHICSLIEWVSAGSSVYATKKAFSNMTNNNNMSKIFDIDFVIDVSVDQRHYLDNIDTLDLLSDEIKVYKLPGHTDCGMVLQIVNNLFVGDLIFNNGLYGRCDCPNSNIEKMAQSLEYINTLPDNLVVYSGHGCSFRLGDFKPYKVN